MIVSVGRGGCLNRYTGDDGVGRVAAQTSSCLLDEPSSQARNPKLNKSDKVLQEDIINELAWDPAVDATRVGLAVKDGVVSLTGHLDTYVEKDAAMRAVRRVAGVRPSPSRSTASSRQPGTSARLRGASSGQRPAVRNVIDELQIA